MKKILLLIATIFIFISCSKDETIQMKLYGRWGGSQDYHNIVNNSTYTGVINQSIQASRTFGYDDSVRIYDAPRTYSKVTPLPDGVSFKLSDYDIVSRGGCIDEDSVVTPYMKRLEFRDITLKLDGDTLYETGSYNYYLDGLGYAHSYYLGEEIPNSYTAKFVKRINQTQ